MKTLALCLLAGCGASGPTAPPPRESPTYASAPAFCVDPSEHDRIPLAPLGGVASRYEARMRGIEAEDDHVDLAQVVVLEGPYEGEEFDLTREGVTLPGIYSATTRFEVRPRSDDVLVFGSVAAEGYAERRFVLDRVIVLSPGVAPLELIVLLDYFPRDDGDVVSPERIFVCVDLARRMTNSIRLRPP